MSSSTIVGISSPRILLPPSQAQTSPSISLTDSAGLVTIGTDIGAATSPTSFSLTDSAGTTTIPAVISIDSSGLITITAHLSSSLSTLQSPSESSMVSADSAHDMPAPTTTKSSDAQTSGSGRTYG
ncbi:hypothetical protein D9757_015021 [Collybiopsis confluens]|uniref:Uncharacterized protein n=1 Tax=Collybiopsis confluens TaxID=2823264 RepID=A0A8H5CW05_9AGAR|nr:hypothetical protein D9757_015021 [Collybiopsis confluens]